MKLSLSVVSGGTGAKLLPGRRQFIHAVYENLDSYTNLDKGSFECGVGELLALCVPIEDRGQSGRVRPGRNIQPKIQANQTQSKWITPLVQVEREPARQPVPWNSEPELTKFK